ncbi:MAG: hypothetical protein HZB35_02690 [Nitrospirae bacterium]|nr:hypothetical protein [Nitrospirota bacterium]
MGRRREGQSLWWIAGLLIAAVSLTSPYVSLAEDGGGVSLDEGNASVMGQVADLLSNGVNLNGDGAADLFQTDASPNQDVNLQQTQMPTNFGEVTPEQMGQALENRNASSQSSGRGQNAQPRGR